MLDVFICAVKLALFLVSFMAALIVFVFVVMSVLNAVQVCFECFDDWRNRRAE